MSQLRVLRFIGDDHHPDHGGCWVLDGFQLTWKLKHWNKTQILRLNRIESWFPWGSNPKWPVQFHGSQQSRPRSRVVTSPKKNIENQTVQPGRSVAFHSKLRRPQLGSTRHPKAMVQSINEIFFGRLKKVTKLQYDCHICSNVASWAWTIPGFLLRKHTGPWKEFSSSLSRFLVFWYFERLVHHQKQRIPSNHDLRT